MTTPRPLYFVLVLFYGTIFCVRDSRLAQNRVSPPVAGLLRDDHHRHIVPGSRLEKAETGRLGRKKVTMVDILASDDEDPMLVCMGFSGIKAKRTLEGDPRKTDDALPYLTNGRVTRGERGGIENKPKAGSCRKKLVVSMSRHMMLEKGRQGRVMDHFSFQSTGMFLKMHSSMDL
jgi:hypothetical protein